MQEGGMRYKNLLYVVDNIERSQHIIQVSSKYFPLIMMIIWAPHINNSIKT
jgi:hypothetical protein